MPLRKSVTPDDQRSKILHKYALPPRTRAIILLDIEDSDISHFLLEASRSLDFSIIIARSADLDKGEYSGYDACISECRSDLLDIVSLVQSGVVPILPIENNFPKVFSEFDPMKFTGNAFLFASVEKYKILEKIIRYLENIRYPGDRRTLLSNLAKTF